MSPYAMVVRGTLSVELTDRQCEEVVAALIAEMRADPGAVEAIFGSMDKLGGAVRHDAKLALSALADYLERP